MADIRINALATTAASTASDDYIAVDGSANGTRKLSAYSPTFGGNLVTTGTLTVNSTTDSTSKDTGAIVTEGGLGVEKSATIGGSLTIGGNFTATGTVSTANNVYFTGNQSLAAAGSIGVQNAAGLSLWPKTGVTYDFMLYDAAGNAALYLPTGTKNFTATGNLTVSGTGTSSVAGQLFVGTTTGGNSTGIMQVINNSAASYTQWSKGNSGGGLVGAEGTGLWFYTYTGNLGSESYTERARITSGGNLLLGTVIDGGQKLQVAGTINISNAGSSTIANFTNSANADFQISIAASTSATIGSSTPTSLILKTNNTTALTLDSSQNATFAGSVTAGTTGSLHTLIGPFAATLKIQRDANSNDYFTIGTGAGYTTFNSRQAAANSGFNFNSTNGSTTTTFLTLADTTGNASFYGSIATQNGTASTPASASATGTAGTIKWDASYIYVCTATNTWKRAAIATW